MAKAKRTGNGVEKGEDSKARAKVEEVQRPRRPASRRAPDSDPVNVIRPSRPRSRVNGRERSADTARQAEAKPERANAPRPSVAAAASPTGSDGSTDPWALPQSVRERFVQERRRFYFPDGSEAFRDRGRRLTTGSENTEVVRSLVEIAQTRGWGEIVVEGSERFRREAWRQARLADLEVRGYRPTVTERAALARALARKADGVQLELEVSNHGEALRALGAGESRAPSAPTPGESHADRSSGEARTELWVGTLLDHGREHYRFDPQEDMSYFVRIRNAEGTRTIWGKDLERAITHSLTQPAIGDAVGLRRVGAEKVTVRRRERDGDGQVIGEHALGVERHRWVIEHRGFFEERAEAAALVRDGSVNRKAVAGAHPELVGTFLQLRAAELAARRLRDPQDQQRFVALVRGALAEAVERGDPLQPVRLRNHPARTPERAPRAQEAQRVR